MSAFAEAEARVCLTEGCGTVLSRHNSARVCSLCSNRIEIGGATIHRPRSQRRFPARPPAPARPVLEGAVPLPPPIPGRERTYEEMIAISDTAKAKTPAPTCAECGEPLPKNHEGWLCRLCVTAAALRLDAVVEAEPAADAAVSAPDPAPAPPKTAGAHAGHARKFDWDEAARLFLEGATGLALAETFGVSQRAISTAVRRVLGEDEARRIAAERRNGPRKKPPPAPPVPAPQPRAENPKREPDHMPERAELEARIEQIKLLVDDAQAERDRLTTLVRELLEEWGDINYRLSKMSDAA